MGDKLKTEDDALAELARQEARRCLTFDLGGELFSVGISRIGAVVAYDEMRPAPDMPSFVRGAVVLGETRVPVVDMRIRRGAVPSVATADTRVVVVEVDGGDRFYPLGLVVDALVATPDAASGDI